ncbi:hypothetical protein BAE44_0014078 [Dichanthelium oligosanthes]|uniref:SKP1 component POZ domain-containing protein n=1 Tax=Dichanthelium oligosanthes TaxID=888268 RepID=A0A1E5VID4_9POAL|nr:hypothetical protein BAE44_0014078 [Dichanthelium oligosanthes]
MWQHKQFVVTRESVTTQQGNNNVVDASTESSDETAAAAEEKIVLRSSDGEEFEVEVSVAEISGTIRHVIEDGCVEGGVPVPNVRSTVLSTVLEYLNKKRSAGAAGGDDFREFEVAFR